MPPSTPIYVVNTPGSWADRGWGEEGNKIKNNTVWQEYTGWQRLTGGNTTPFSTRFVAHNTQMESGLGERERTDGQTHKQRADSTPHSQSQSHYIELGPRDWRCNDKTLNSECPWFQKIRFNLQQIWPTRVQIFWNCVHLRKMPSEL